MKVKKAQVDKGVQVRMKHPSAGTVRPEQERCGLICHLLALRIYIIRSSFLKLNFTPTTLREQLKRVDWVCSAPFILLPRASSFPLLGYVIQLSLRHAKPNHLKWRGIVRLEFMANTRASFIRHSMSRGIRSFKQCVLPEPWIRLSIFKNRSDYAETILHDMILWCILC